MGYNMKSLIVVSSVLMLITITGHCKVPNGNEAHRRTIRNEEDRDKNNYAKDIVNIDRRINQYISEGIYEERYSVHSLVGCNKLAQIYYNQDYVTRCEAIHYDDGTPSFVLVIKW